jgi:pimeloyl-ACP methyl ester carboxylesterase
VSASLQAWELPYRDCRPRHRLVSGGVSLAYDTAGDRGAPVLLLMGYTVPGRAWVHQIPTLAEHHRVAWYDHRGCGDTAAEPGAYTMALLAGDARRLLDHLGWDRVHVVGVSMGGMVGQELALRWPARVRSLALIATHAGGLRNRLPPIEGLATVLRALPGPPPERRRGLERMLFPDAFLARCDRGWLDRIVRDDFGRPIHPKFRLSQLAAIWRHDTRSRLEALGAIPTLVVKPALDKLVSPEACAHLSRRIPGARLLTYPDAGHGVIRQCAPQLNSDLLDHFAAADTQP